MNSQEQIESLEQALHDLVTSDGLFAHDGKSDEQFQLDHKHTIEKLTRVIEEMKNEG